MKPPTTKARAISCMPAHSNSTAQLLELAAPRLLPVGTYDDSDEPELHPMLHEASA